MWKSVLGGVLTSSVTQQDRSIVGGACKHHRLQENRSWGLFSFRFEAGKRENTELNSCGDDDCSSGHPLSLRSSLAVFAPVL